MGDNFERNLELVRALEAMAARKRCTASQLALAWVLSRGKHVVAIPGTRSVTRLAENAAAAQIALSPIELAELETIVPRDAAAGTRYTEGGMKTVNR
jgi:aryl-alcohol dehydrogenase-like predicted oxidoreductase